MAKALSITAPHGVFWRAGLRFSPEARVVALDELSKEQLEKIRNEPRLVVEAADLPGDKSEAGAKAEPGDAAAGSKGGKKSAK